MKKYEGRLVGILGTAIVHLAAAIIFMSFQMHSLSNKESDDFVIEFEPLPESDNADQMIALPATSIERIFQDDQEMLNIARNLANRPDVNIDPDEYIDRVKEEMIRNGQLGEDNYIDEQKKADSRDEEIITAENPSETDVAEEPDESELMAANYSGPTRIYYDLARRNHTYLPVPIYKCEGSGKVTLAIEVSQNGIVESAKVISGESTTADACLLETAVRTALRSRFNSDINSPKIQTGTLTYLFVAQ